MTQASESAIPTIDFDHHSPTYATRWQELYGDMRQRCPVAHTTAHGGYYVLSRYADVDRAVKDDATFSSKHELDPESIWGGITQPPPPVISIPIELDPPEFTPFRKVLNPWFSPNRARELEPWIRDVTTGLLDDVIETGRIDFVSDLASPVPAILTARLLGVPMSDWRMYSDAAHAIVYTPPGSPEYDVIIGDFIGLIMRCLETAAVRRENPQDDLITLFTKLEIDGTPIDDDTIGSMCSLIINGGNDTTTSLLACALKWLSEHPDQRAWLQEDLERLGPACEEFLRFFTPTQGLMRTVTTDVEIAGRALHRGDRVMLSFAAANHDPEAFDAPEEIILDRFPNRHQAFGLGLHRCLGSNLTRVEFRIVMEEVLRRMPDFVVDGDASTPYSTIGIVNGYVDMPATFTPGPKVGSNFARS